jgi:hypothetical protein
VKINGIIAISAGDMTEPPLNQVLLELMLTAQRHMPGSRERQKALSQLFRQLKQPGVLARPRSNQFQGFYNDIYEEAVQRLFIYIHKNLDAYTAERGTVLAWVNFLFCQRFFIEASRDFMPTGYRGMNMRQVTIISVDDLDRTIVESRSQQSTDSSLHTLRSYLQEDPQGSFSDAHIEKHPEISFRWIALQRLDGYGWRELSEQSGISPTTLSSFYQRNFKKFLLRIKQDLL